MEDLPLDQVGVADSELWEDGPPLETLRRLRAECPVHHSGGMSAFPDATGFWSVTTQEHVREVSRDWQTFSSERNGFVLYPPSVVPYELTRSMFIGMDPPKHDKLKSLFQLGFAPKRIARHEPEIRAIVTGVLDGLEGRQSADMVSDVAAPIVGRVIGSFMGIPPEDDASWTELMAAIAQLENPAANPEGPAAASAKYIPEVFERTSKRIAERREHPTDDLLSVLVHAEVEGERLNEAEIVMGFFLLLFAGMDSTRATYAWALRALLENPDQRQLLLDDPALIPDAVEEALRMFPAFSHFMRTATRDVELGGQQIREGDKVALWYVSTGRDEKVYDDPDRFDVRRRPEHMAFGGGGRHFCLGAALARLELRVMFEETLKRYPRMALDGKPVPGKSIMANQLTSLPVRLG